MELNNIQSLYFLGAGGIGMSALIRYFLSNGKRVAGYDLTPSELTTQLNKEGAEIHYEDNITLIPDYCTRPETTLVVYTPAVPTTLGEFRYFQEKGFSIVKRAELLGIITRQSRALCVAGTHGKTTTSSMLAHLLKQSTVDCNAFLGGILKNYGSNLMLSQKSDLTVIEADEFDRSFHHLSPYMAIITSVAPDHLDIYETEAAYRESFRHFASLIHPGGTLLLRKGIKLDISQSIRLFTYSASEGGDFHAEKVRYENGKLLFDFIGPNVEVKEVELGLPIPINVENAVAAMAVAYLNGVKEDELRTGMKTFAGPRRRFDFILRTETITLIDDYAHHPEELKASIQSVRALYNKSKLTVVFQPHLYTRTRDFAKDFAESLSLADELILLDIYPAREKPIEGVDAHLIFDQVTIANKQLTSKEELLSLMEKREYEVVLMVGAGDIDRLVTPVKELLEKQQ